MEYQAEIRFLKNLLSQYRLNIHEIIDFDSDIPNIDLGIRQFLGLEDEYAQILESMKAHIKPNIIYDISDDFLCKYFAIHIKTSDAPIFLIIGPYTDHNLTKQELIRAIEKYQVPPMLVERMIQYYGNITCLSDFPAVHTILSAFADSIWDAPENYSFETVHYSFADSYVGPIPERILEHITEQEDISFKMQLLEKRYEAENRFIKYISQGNYHKAEAAFDNSNLFDIENRITDPVRNLKNYSIVMNTLLRKAAELGTVHPIHIDRLSSSYAQKIESIHSLEQGISLMKEMIRKYSLLVKNYSMTDYSLLIQKVIARVDSDITADQSLNVHAKLLNVSPSYLSTLFRKETGITLTEYVNKKRVEYSIFLLNTTNMQIQTIAQHCGILDINYFTRLFKKQIGKTPKEYRKELNL